MLKDPVFLISAAEVSLLYGKHNDAFVIGRTLTEGIPVSLPWERLFNTHMGIFGNTGSGKSNTLAKLFTVLFHHKKEVIAVKSEFIVLDFNGEYTQNQFIDKAYKRVYRLSTREETPDKFPLAEQEFWDAATLGILFKATVNTQLPFLHRVVNGRKRYRGAQHVLSHFTKATFQKVFTSPAPRREALELLHEIAVILEAKELQHKLKKVAWHSDRHKFYVPEEVYFDGGEPKYQAYLSQEVEALSCDKLDPYSELIVRMNLQLVNDLMQGYVQSEHIQPLLKRMEASVAALRRVIRVEEGYATSEVLTIISLRRCNQEIKKILPLLLAKHYYQQHKHKVQSPPNKTIHLIIDEAHNVLSQQSIREQESWKDYRIELFEEIIKEGRKFGVFLTLVSQRPADISPTIMSQLHNFFIHRLVNDKDLALLDTTISTLDGISKNMIPHLGKGCCIITGTSFDLPLVLQVEPLEKEYQPDSDDVNLRALWVLSEEAGIGAEETAETAETDEIAETDETAEETIIFDT